jgi:hypothetical protein
MPEETQKTEGLTKDELVTLIKETAEEAAGPALQAALAPHLKTQSDLMEKFAERFPAQAEEMAINKALGPRSSARPAGR